MLFNKSQHVLVRNIFPLLTNSTVPLIHSIEWIWIALHDERNNDFGESWYSRKYWLIIWLMAPEYARCCLSMFNILGAGPWVHWPSVFFFWEKIVLSTDHQDAALRECSIGTIMRLLVIETKSNNSKTTCIAVYILKCVTQTGKNRWFRQLPILPFDEQGPCAVLWIKNQLQNAQIQYWPQKWSSQSQATKQIGKTYLVGGFNPSEKYERQLGLLFPIYGKYKMF